MAETKLKSSQISDLAAGGTIENFSGTPGNVTSFVVTAGGVVRSFTFSFGSTTDAEYRLSASGSFGNLSGAQKVSVPLYYDGASTTTYLQAERDAGGTQITFKLSTYNGNPIGAGAWFSALNSWNNRRYACSLFR